MTDCYVKLNFPRDLADYGVTGVELDSLPGPYPCVPAVGDRLMFPEHLSNADGTPALFIVVRRIFTSLSTGVQRSDLELAYLDDEKTTIRW